MCYFSFSCFSSKGNNFKVSSREKCFDLVVFIEKKYAKEMSPFHDSLVDHEHDKPVCLLLRATGFFYLSFYIVLLWDESCLLNTFFAAPLFGSFHPFDVLLLFLLLYGKLSIPDRSRNYTFGYSSSSCWLRGKNKHNYISDKQQRSLSIGMLQYQIPLKAFGSSIWVSRLGF